jgi:hypothetical protein
MPEIDFSEVIENAVVALGNDPGIPQASGGLDKDDEQSALEPPTPTGDAWCHIFPLPELLSTVAPDGSVPARDEESPIVPQGMTKPRSRRAIAKGKVSHIQKRPRLVTDDAIMFVFAVLVFGGRFTQ